MNTNVNRFLAAERALRTAAPHRLVEEVRRVLTESYAVEGADLLMADYGLTVLRPVGGEREPGAETGLHNTPQGRAFASQQPLLEETGDGRVLVHLPVSVRGDRLGVLSLTAAADRCGPDAVAEWSDLAQVLAREVVIAERDTDLYLRARRRSRLTLAAEMQWRLLPGNSRVHREYAWGAHLVPAYAIDGDNFDLSADDDRLTVTVTSGMGEGAEAAQLTGLTISALRNARRAGLGVADQAALADQAVFAHYRGRAHLSVLLLEFEFGTGRVQVVDAGSPRLLRLRSGAVEPVEFEPQLPLGMFEETDYAAQEFFVEPGDRLVIVSDGVHATAPDAERDGLRALARAITTTRLLSAAEMPGAVLRVLAGHREITTPDADALVLCLDWFGR
ncbi:PP2C family protein-serine/threonine phosphatase [Streptomyces sp. SL54]|uniref:PP2C family protein-serine/threonine phosphatase n=1 Tax=Streptantibioticus silvisoli TaxID=2705255 RepID=A0ABT6W3Z7_9ACTN|nr:PP2C family protein-serine/threonine phosphatase [Streptantibioticus silvisoli]MDI5964398.1 PP2C family protein-serine/threonine phosphatase [Streptantibioticus silvisoli]